MKTATQQTHPGRGRLWGALILALLAVAAWFGLPSSARLAALGFLALFPFALFRREWAFWAVLAAFLGFGAFLLTFRISGYRYAALLFFAVAALLPVFRFGGRRLRRLIGLAAGLALCLVMAAEVPIVSAALSAGESQAPYVIVLGAAVYGENPSLTLRHRCDRASAHLRSNPDAVAVVSGGQGPGESISEAEAMGRYLVNKGGIAEDRILREDRSTSTRENLTFSKEIIESSGGDSRQVAIVSSSYHLYRAKRMAAALGMAADGLPSSDGYPLYMAGMYLREALAVWKLWLLGI